MKKIKISNLLNRAFCISELGILYSSNFILDKYYDNNNWLKVTDIHELYIVEIEGIINELAFDNNQINKIIHNQINFITE